MGFLPILDIRSSLVDVALDHARDLARERQLPEADSAELKLSNEAARTATPLATAVVSHGEFLFLCFFSNGGRSSHSLSPIA
jgi:hypothetical protein